jgi:hypothetical protein
VKIEEKKIADAKALEPEKPTKPKEVRAPKVREADSD